MAKQLKRNKIKVLVHVTFTDDPSQVVRTIMVFLKILINHVHNSNVISFRS